MKANMPMNNVIKRLATNHFLWIILIGCILFIYGNGNYSLFDNSETNYSAVAQEITRSGDLLTMHYNDKPWYVHPPLYFWMANSLCTVAGWNEFNLRLFEGLFGVLGLLMTYLLAAQFFEKKTAFNAALILGTSFIYFVIARLAIFDTQLNFFVLASLLLFFKAYYNPEKKGLYFFFFALTSWGAVMTKGPIGLLHPGMVIVPFLAFRKNLKFLFDWKILLNFILFFVLVSPWYIYQLTNNGWPFFEVALKNYTWYRFFGVIENQSGPWYYYFPVLLLCFPWIFFLPTVINQRFKSQVYVTPKNKDFILFAWLFIVISFVFFSIAGTKLPNYIFSIFPFLAILIAHYFDTALERDYQGLRGYSLLLFGFSAILFIYTLVLTLPYPYHGDEVLLRFFFLFPAVTSGYFLFLIFKKQIQKAVYVMVIGTLVFVLFLVNAFFPALEKYKDSKVFVETIKPYSKPYKVVNYASYSPYLMFYLNQKVEHVDTLAELTKLISAVHQPVFIIIPNGQADKITALLPENYQLLKIHFQQSLLYLPPSSLK